MPLMDDEPPITLPRGQWMRRLFINGSGSDSYIHVYFLLAMGYDKADGM